MSEGQTPVDPATQASRWLVRLESPDASREDHLEFAAWMNASREHRLAFEAVGATWDRLNGLKRLAPTHAPPRPSRGKTIIAAAGIAAVTAVLLIALAPWRALETYATPVGGHRTITLPDRSTAELNAATRIRVVYSGASRRVFLDEGEALFEVRNDAGRTFVVETRFGAVRARGTSFVVRLMANAARATVIRGRVECDAVL